MELDEQTTEPEKTQELPPADETTKTGDIATDGLIAFGEQVKAVRQDGNLLIVEALGVRFGSENEPDLQGDYFTKDTYFGHNEGNGADATLNHRMPIKTGNKKVDNYLRELSSTRFKYPIKTFRRDEGLVTQHILDLALEYEAWVGKLVKEGAFSWSSGSASHMVDREEDGKLKSWNIVEFAYTPTPAEPRLPRIAPVKSLENLLLNIPQEREAEAEVSEAKLTDHKQSDAVIVILDNDKEQLNNQENNTMSDNPQSEFEAKLAALSAGFDAKFESLLDAITKNRRLADAGLIADQDTTGRETVKTFADFLLAVRNRNNERLVKVYKSRPVGEDNARGSEAKGLTMTNGATGAWLLPTDFSTQLLTVQEQTSPLLAKVRKIPVTVESGQWPSLDITRTPTAGAGNTALAGGLESSPRDYGGTYSSESIYFDQIQFRLRNQSALVNVDQELINYSPASIEQLLMQTIALQVNSKKERNILRGSGVGEPLGILTSADTLVNVTPATNNAFGTTDPGAMLAKLRIVDRTSVMWVIHPSIIKDLAALELSTGSGVTYMQNYSSGINMPLMGFPVHVSEHLPQENNSGAVLLIDASAYGLWQNGEVAIAYSEHYGFGTGQVTWRFDARYDGRPLVTGVTTLADPQGSYTQSPFVAHND